MICNRQDWVLLKVRMLPHAAKPRRLGLPADRLTAFQYSQIAAAQLKSTKSNGMEHVQYLLPCFGAADSEPLLRLWRPAVCLHGRE